MIDRRTLPDDGSAIYFREVSKAPLLTVEEEWRLAERIRQGDKAALDELVEKNLRLVIRIANDYRFLGLDLLDLIQEGNRGLYTAATRFDPRKGGKMSTYAAWWIKQSIKRALANQGRTIRLPVHLIDKISKLRSVATGMSDALGREPTDEELAEETGISLKKITQLRAAHVGTTSLQTPVVDEGDAEFGDLVADESVVSADDTLIHADDMKHALSLLHILDARERTILVERFGLSGGRPKTLETIGRKFKITRERIRQLQNIALAKLRRAMIRRGAVSRPDEDYEEAKAA